MRFVYVNLANFLVPYQQYEFNWFNRRHGNTNLSLIMCKKKTLANKYPLYERFTPVINASSFIFS